MIRNYLIIFFLLIFAACTNNTVRDYTSLKQKALEIPPDFELTPPVVGEEEVEEAAPTGESAEDIQDITKLNFNAGVGLTGGFEQFRLTVQYQYGINNILNKLNDKNLGNTDFKGNLSMLMGGITIYL